MDVTCGTGGVHDDEQVEIAAAARVIVSRCGTPERKFRDFKIQTFLTSAL